MAKRNEKRVVKLKSMPPPGREHEHQAALRELSPTGLYVIAAEEKDDGDTFYTLVGGMTYHSAELFDVMHVETAKVVPGSQLWDLIMASRTATPENSP